MSNKIPYQGDSKIMSLRLGYSYDKRVEYARLTTRENVTRMAQITINNLCDYARKCIEVNHEQFQSVVTATVELEANMPLLVKCLDNKNG